MIGVDGQAYTSDQATIWRWRTAFQHDFAARMDWTVDDVAHANHNPVVVVNGSDGKAPIAIDATVGTPVTLDASATRDPRRQCADVFVVLLSRGGHRHSGSARVRGRTSRRVRAWRRAGFRRHPKAVRRSPRRASRSIARHVACHGDAESRWHGPRHPGGHRRRKPDADVVSARDSDDSRPKVRKHLRRVRRFSRAQARPARSSRSQSVQSVNPVVPLILRASGWTHDPRQGASPWRRHASRVPDRPSDTGSSPRRCNIRLCAFARSVPVSVFRGGVDLVTVDLTIVDSGGNPVLWLSPSDVDVLVDGSSRRVASWVSVPLPVTSAHESSPQLSSRTVILIVDPSTMSRGEGMQALHAAARFIDRTPPSDRISVAVLPFWETAVRFGESRATLKDRLLHGVGNGIANTPLDGRRQQQIAYMFSSLAAIDGPKQVILIEGTERSERPPACAPMTWWTSTGLASVASAWRSRVIVHALQVYESPGWAAMSAEHRESSLPKWTHVSTTDRLLSTETGGLAMSPVSGDSFFQRLERERGGGYVIAFEPIYADRDGKPHTIAVTVKDSSKDDRASAARVHATYAVANQVVSRRGCNNMRHMSCQPLTETPRFPQVLPCHRWRSGRSLSAARRRPWPHRPRPAGPPRIQFAAIGLNHGHINGQVDAVIRGGGELVSFYAKEPDLIEAFQKRYPQAKLARRGRRSSRTRPSSSSSAPRSRANARRSASEVMRHGKDFMADKPGMTTLEQLAEVRKVQAETKRIYSILYSERHENKATVKAGELVKAGAIGKVIQTDRPRAAPHDPEDAARLVLREGALRRHPHRHRVAPVRPVPVLHGLDRGRDRGVAGRQRATTRSIPASRTSAT